MLKYYILDDKEKVIVIVKWVNSGILNVTMEK